MEHCCFGFQPFEQDVQVHSLYMFLQFFNNFQLENVEEFVHDIAADLILGLLFRHQNRIIHRDMKPSNVLVSNMYYTSLGSTELTDAIKKQKIICKLSDSGKAYSSFTQTKT